MNNTKKVNITVDFWSSMLLHRTSRLQSSLEILVFRLSVVDKRTSNVHVLHGSATSRNMYGEQYVEWFYLTTDSSRKTAPEKASRIY